AGLLGPEGPLANLLPGYEHRESQMQMLLAVAQIQSRGGMLVVEAGTGTGKSLAYLVPSIARSVKHRERVVVSTNTHTLQEQLMVKDLPSLREWLPWEFKAVLLKGRSNYVSLRRWRRYLAEPCQDADELMFKLKVLLWRHTTWRTRRRGACGKRSTALAWSRSWSGSGMACSTSCSGIRTSARPGKPLPRLRRWRWRHRPGWRTFSQWRMRGCRRASASPS